MPRYNLPPSSTRNEVAIRERRVTDDGRGFAWPQVGTRSGRVQIAVDIEALSKLLGRRALKNRNGRATLADGAIVATTFEVQEVRS